MYDKQLCTLSEAFGVGRRVKYYYFESKKQKEL